MTSSAGSASAAASGGGASDAAGAVGAVWRGESARIIGALMRMVRDVGLAEELAQDALVAALQQWPGTGVPDNPGAWLMTVAKRRAADHLRRAAVEERAQDSIGRDLSTTAPIEAHSDDELRLMFLSCHPVLASRARVALTLQVVGGLTTAEIARALLSTEARVARRCATAKRTLAEAGVPFELPGREELAGRLSAVLEVIYLIFNEGYSATSGDDLLRPALTLEALRLGRLLATLMPQEPEVHGLVALMEIQESRAAARTGPAGEPVPLAEQNRGRWDPLLIRRGFTAMLRARELGGPPGPYLLQAAIAVTHAQARTAEATDWVGIAALYDALVRLLPTPVVQLNRAVAVAMARGPEEGLAIADTVADDPRLIDYHLLPAVRGDLLARCGRPAEARREFERAAALTANAAQSAFLLQRAGSLEDGAAGGLLLGASVEAFLGRAELSGGTLWAYRQTWHRLRRILGERAEVRELTPQQVARAFAIAWDACAAATWNRHLAAVRSFAESASAPHLAAALNRRAPAPDPDRRAPAPFPAAAAQRTSPPLAGRNRKARRRGRTPAMAPAEVSDLLQQPNHPLRERTLWTLLHESGAGAAAALALDLDDLDLDDRQALSGITWRSRTARLLPELIGERTRGPLFLAERRPGPGRPRQPGDVCPDTGRGRLSYERAEYLFKQATGLTLRQLV